MNLGEIRTDPPTQIRNPGNHLEAGMGTSNDPFQTLLECSSTAVRPHSRQEYLQAILPKLAAMLGAVSGGLVVQDAGHWKQDAWTGETIALPTALIADALDGSQVLEGSDGVVVAPQNSGASELASYDLFGEFDPASQSVGAFVWKLDPNAAHNQGQAAFRSLVSRACDHVWHTVRRIDLITWQHERIAQLSTVLEASASWGRLKNDDDLLRAIADTACELLDCERASIFLWDRRRSKLIGRPALGVEGGALEVDDNAGIVGEVLSTVEPRFWKAKSDPESRVNRSVDLAQDYQTDSIVAVPMFGSREQVIGVFEALNHRGDGFQASDAEILTHLALHASVAIDSLRTQAMLTKSRDRLVEDAADAVKLVGNHDSMQAVRSSADKVAGTDLTVLVLGKNGTGKEVLARHIHYASQRRSGPFIAVNCAALVETLLESELFGHEQGAFTDAQSTRVGKFELANGGTLFLDEVGDMSPGGQAKLLRVLEEKVVVRVGGSQTIPVDVRVIAATNQPLESLIEQKRFREDLFFRLNVVSLTLPPLSSRGDDVLLLAEHFLSQFRYEIGRPELRLGEDAKQAMMSHPWPGNVRELRNTMERVSYLTTGETIQVEDLMLRGTSLSPVTSESGDATAGGLPNSVTLTDASREFQIGHIRRAIDAVGGNMTAAADRLGLHRSNLYRKMRQLGMPTNGE